MLIYHFQFITDLLDLSYALNPSLILYNNNKTRGLREFQTSCSRFRITNLERNSFSLSSDLKNILVGLLLGDLYAKKRSLKGNTYLHFEQGLTHEAYILHLYELFSKYSGDFPKYSDRQPDFRTGKIYSRVSFVTYSLPCFNELYSIFYINGKKIVPLNIDKLLTRDRGRPLALGARVAPAGLRLD